MIASPHNDHECLGAATAKTVAMVEADDPAVVALAERFTNIDHLAAYFRTLPQRDDHGIPSERPKVAACRPAQRLQFDSDAPNCFERTFRFMAGAEKIDPSHVYRAMTIQTEDGLHTFPTCDGEPVILDPLQTRNKLRAAVYRACRNGDGADVAMRRLRIQRLIGTDETRGVRGDLGRARASKAAGYTTWVHGEPIDEAIEKYETTLARYQALLDEIADDSAPRNGWHARARIEVTPRQAIDWIAELAHEAAKRFRHGPRRVRKGHRALLGVLMFRPICIGDVKHVAFVLALAEREAGRFGPSERRIVHTVARAVDQLDRLAAARTLPEPDASSVEPAAPRRPTTPRTLPRNGAPSIKIGDYTLSFDARTMNALGRVGARVAGNAAIDALKVKLAQMGVSGPMLSSVEGELNKEGLTLGPLATPPPMLGSLGSLTPEAIAGRALAALI